MKSDELIDWIVEQLKPVAGVAGLVLGGSRARGTHTPASDIDLGIYYDPAAPLDLEALARVAAALDDQHRSGLVTPVGGWGPNINGGAWLTVQATPVDFIYRDLAKMEAVLAACQAGRVEVFYQPGHPHAFTSAIYMGELAICQPRWDPHGRLAALQAGTRPYPPALRDEIVRIFAWEIDFALATAHKGIPRWDAPYVAGCCFRAAMCILQVLFALNGQYWLNEKGAAALAQTFPIRPDNLQARLDSAFAALAPNTLAQAIAILEEVGRETKELV